MCLDSTESTIASPTGSRSARYTVAIEIPCMSAQPSIRRWRSGERTGKPSSFPRGVTRASSEGRRRMSRVGFGDVVIERRFRDPHHPADLADRVLLLSIELRHQLPLGGIQNLRPAILAPRARAAFSPAWVRSRTRLRSNSARAPNIWNTSLPPLELVSIFSCTLIRPMPISSSFLPSRIRSCNDRAGGRGRGVAPGSAESPLQSRAADGPLPSRPIC